MSVFVPIEEIASEDLFPHLTNRNLPPGSAILATYEQRRAYVQARLVELAADNRLTARALMLQTSRGQRLALDVLRGAGQAPDHSQEAPGSRPIPRELRNYRVTVKSTRKGEPMRLKSPHRRLVGHRIAPARLAAAQKVEVWENELEDFGEGPVEVDLFTGCRLIAAGGLGGKFSQPRLAKKHSWCEEITDDEGRAVPGNGGSKPPGRLRKMFGGKGAPANAQ